ncbi:MAG: TetR/AcrR family transcriptional regulator [Lachnospiraceae bacterium]|nr:TetR/AcrR family transcriptional regulator [Lachnospiraceae bacterium]
MYNKAEARQRIVIAMVEVYREKGLDFTMDDIAKHLSMSKKTIYKLFNDKEEIFLAVLDHVFARIKEAEREVVADESLGTVEKLIKLLSAMPLSMEDIDFSKPYPLKTKYPRVYDQICLRLESDWDDTVELLEKGIKEGVFRPVSIPIFKMAYSASLERLLERDDATGAGISYKEARLKVSELLVMGLTK